MKISIIIPNWNGKHFLEKCLPSIEKQTFKDFEVIIVDNGSKDKSVFYVKNNFSSYKIIQFDKNKGFSVAVNAGIKKASADYIFLLNNDTELDKMCLERLMFGVKKSNSAMFACKILNFYQRNYISSVGDSFSIYGYAYQRYNWQKDSSRIKNEKIFSVCAGAGLYKKKLFDKVGFFDEDFFAYLEDVDFSFRAQLIGYEAEFISDAIVYHIEGGTSKTLKDFTIYYSLRNNLILLYKNLPFSLFILLFPFIFVYQLRNWIIWTEAKKTKIVYLSYKDFLKDLEKFKNKRKEIQINKKISTYKLLKKMSKKYPFRITKTVLRFLKKFVFKILKIIRCKKKYQ